MFTRRALPAAVILALLVAAATLLLKYGQAGPRSVAYDLAERLPFAARSTPNDLILFGWPDAEPHLGRGFGGDPEFRGRERFLWARQGASLKLEVREAHDRVLVFDLEAYPETKSQRLTLSANGSRIGTEAIPSTRSRVKFDWTAAAQRETNEIALEFSTSIVPANQGGTSGDTRDFAAALFSLTVGDARDPAIDLLLERETPRAYALVETSGVPSFVLPGKSQTSFAFRLPKNGSVEFESSLDPWSASSGGKGSLQIAFEATDGRARESLRIPLDSAKAATHRIALEGDEGTPFIVRMDVISDNPAATYARIRAPRIMGGAPKTEVAAPAAEVVKFREDLAARKPNLLFVVLDAARAQSLGAYGYARNTTPNIDALTDDGFVFDNAYTTAAYTLAAMSSIWTSQQPDRHHGDVAFSAKLPKDRLRLAEVLSAQGIHTAGFVANAVAGAFYGFDQGFSEFDEPWKRYGSQASGFRNVVPAFLDRMKRDKQRFFAYVHFREPHHPYDPPPPFDTMFGPDSPIPRARRQGGEPADTWTRAINQGAITPSTDEIDHLRRLYDGNLAFADQEVGFLLGELKARGLLDNTVVIIAGDHGEGLYEHAFIGHNTQVFEETAHIPLIIVLPTKLRATRSPARLDQLVDHTDIAPTILEVFGLTGAGGSAQAFQGSSLLPAIVGPRPGRESDLREVLTRTVWDRPIYALRNASHTFIYNTATTEMSLFDRASAPRLEDKEHDYAPRAPLALRETYRQNLLAWVASLKRRSAAGDRPEGMTREQCEELKALGYLSAKTKCPG